MNFLYFLYCNCNLLSLKITLENMFIDLSKSPLPENLEHYVDLKHLILKQLRLLSKTDNLEEIHKKKNVLLKILEKEEEQLSNYKAAKKSRQDLLFLIHFLEFVEKVVKKEKPIFAKNLSYLKDLKNNFIEINCLLLQIQKNPLKWKFLLDDVLTLADTIASKCEKEINGYLSKIVSVFGSIWLEWNKYTLLEREEKKIDEIYNKLLSDFLQECHSTQSAKYKSLISKSQQKFMAEYLLIN
ncbi:hypothetical protein TUBRATIS_19440 [Tubulinosema ratisbonensis]|uniref:Uncharacterized protein n=1 Tax=Tubulinosema ratisbonensis TaxID=291195 RepID=A0A437AKF0_9MICR|nr:hypothetical protein TUBRATIS_19440 [Tubulinosema ratisbonensis]